VQRTQYVLTVAFFLAMGLCAPAMAWSERLIADVNGDGLRDTIEFNHQRNDIIVSVVHRAREQHLLARREVVRLVLADVDLDGDSDVVASTMESGLHVWTNDGHGRFAPWDTAGFVSGWLMRRVSFQTGSSRRVDDEVWSDGPKLPLVQRVQIATVTWAPLMSGHVSESPISEFHPDWRVPRGPPRS
jgi:hypothetical protein